jgi:hypothetical protein
VGETAVPRLTRVVTLVARHVRTRGSQVTVHDITGTHVYRLGRGYRGGRGRGRSYK